MGKKYILPFVGLLSGLIAIFLMVGYKIVPLFSHADVLGIKSIIFTPTPTLPPLKGTILFVSNKNGNYDIYKMNLATLETIPLTSDSSDEMNPQLSPDNSHIVYYSNRDGDNEIYTIDLATNTLTQLTKNTAGDYDPSYSPDGKQIVFKSNRDDGYGDIFIMNANGTGQKNLTPNRKSSEEWIPVFTKDGAVARAYVNGVRDVEFNDAQNRAQIGQDGVINLLREADANYAPGGKIARVRLYQGALTDAEVAALDDLAPITAPGASGAPVTADYRLESALKSSVGGAPDLILEGVNYAESKSGADGDLVGELSQDAGL